MICGLRVFAFKIFILFFVFLSGRDDPEDIVYHPIAPTSEQLLRASGEFRASAPVIPIHNEPDLSHISNYSTFQLHQGNFPKAPPGKWNKQNISFLNKFYTTFYIFITMDYILSFVKIRCL